MADRAIRQDHVIAKHALFHAANPLDGLLRAEVARVRFELNADRAERLEFRVYFACVPVSLRKA